MPFVRRGSIPKEFQHIDKARVLVINVHAGYVADTKEPVVTIQIDTLELHYPTKQARMLAADIMVKADEAESSARAIQSEIAK